MADTIKCPNCTANLKFDAGVQQLTCEYCGASFNPSAFSGIPNELSTGESIYDTVVATESDFEKSEESVDEGKKIDYQQTEFKCNSCGATIVTDSNTSATFCAFCGSPALVGQRLTKEFEPKYIIPFQIPREKAVDIFIGWAKGGRWTPFGFVSDKNIEKLTGLYVPFWLFNVDAHVDAKGTGSKSVYKGDDEIIREIEWERVGDLKWRNIPLDGETRIDDALMEAIEPFHYTKMIPFDYKYLPGFYADRYDLEAKDLSDRCKARVKGEIDDYINRTLKDFTTKDIKKNDTKLTSISANYALLPVWFMSYKYLGKYYYFAINGETGEACGDMPVSPLKKSVFFFLVLGILAVVARFILGCFMRGIWG